MIIVNTRNISHIHLESLNSALVSKYTCQVECISQAAAFWQTSREIDNLSSERAESERRRAEVQLLQTNMANVTLKDFLERG